MNKTEFLNELCEHLRHLPDEQQECAAHYYSGVIDGRMESGISEQDAVAAFGGAEKTALEFISSIYSKESNHRISSKIKAMPTLMRIISSVLLSIVCFGLIAAMWAVLASVYIVIALIGLGGFLFILSGIVMCFIRTVPVGLCVTGIGMVLVAIIFLLLGPARMITRLFTSLTGAIGGKVRALLAKEALAV